MERASTVRSPAFSSWFSTVNSLRFGNHRPHSFFPYKEVRLDALQFSPVYYHFPFFIRWRKGRDGWTGTKNKCLYHQDIIKIQSLSTFHTTVAPRCNGKF